MYVTFKGKGTAFCYFSDPFLHSMSKTSLSDERKKDSQPFSWSYRGFLSFIEHLVIGEQGSAAQQRILKWCLVLFWWY